MAAKKKPSEPSAVEVAKKRVAAIALAKEKKAAEQAQKDEHEKEELATQEAEAKRVQDEKDKAKEEKAIAEAKQKRLKAEEAAQQAKRDADAKAQPSERLAPSPYYVRVFNHSASDLQILSTGLIIPSLQYLDVLHTTWSAVKASNHIKYLLDKRTLTVERNT